ncbi:MAG: STAS domain-containing protein, partial [Chloroflexota bacterium]|nr:STAS domain-containing protein [Chloroflexota bacterium]
MIDDGTRRILINLKEVNFIDSSGLGIFVAAYKMMNQVGGAIKFAKPQKTLEKIFELTRTHKVFEIFDSIDEALKSF